MMDRHLAALDAMGCVIALTADHGMNAKTGWTPARRDLPAGLLDGWIGAERARVILPITDPYVVHHGALGSFATVYLPRPTWRPMAPRGWPVPAGIERVLTRAEAAAAYELPADRIGDLVVVSERFVVIGTSAKRATTCRSWNCRCARTAASPSSACR
jgi:phosphonoacetate hydrolase